MPTLAINGGTPVRSTPFPVRKTMGPAEKQAAMAVLDSDHLSGFFGSPGEQWLGGPEVKAFERKWADAYGFKHAISVNSWTTGLMTAIGAVGIEAGDEVIVSPYTMSASATAIVFYGGIPVFADIDPETFNISAATIARAITPRTKAIMVVHIFGQAADMDPIMALARQHGLKVIEDAAQAPGVFYKGRPVGTIGDIGGFSLNYHKHIHTGEGGVLVTNDDRLAQRCQLIRNHGENLVEWLGVDDIQNLVGSNYRLTEMQAAIGSAQLDRLGASLAHRQHLAAHFSGQLRAMEVLAPPHSAEGAGHAYYLYAMRYQAGRTGIPRSLFVKAVNAELPKPTCWEQTVLVEGYLKPLYLLPMYQRKVALGSHGLPWSFNSGVDYDYRAGLCPTLERVQGEELVITPMIREPLGTGDIDDIAAAIAKVLRHRSELA
jgi:dTDP-4-amino-4,6-dideoxygalactose transaminase